MDQSSICFVINAKSHRVARHGSWLEAALPDLPDIQVLRLDDFDALDTRIGDLARRGVHRFFIEGGDGTVLAVLSACAGHAQAFVNRPEYAILPGGSTNLAYKIVGFRARNARSFRARIKALLNGTQSAHVDQSALSVSMDGRPAPVNGFVVSTGTLARAMSYVQREFHGVGHRGSLAVAQAIFRFLIAPHKYLDRDGLPVLRGTQLHLQADMLAYDAPHCLSLITCLPRLSLGVKPFWGKEQGEISITYARWPMKHFRSGLVEALLWKREKHLRGKGFSSHRARQVALQTEDLIMVDGEVFTPAPGSVVTISVTEPKRFLR